MTDTTTSAERIPAALDKYRVCVDHGRRECDTCSPIPMTLDQLPSFPELLLEQARRHVADGTLPLATARHYFPGAGDWPEPPSDDEPELTEHQRDLVRSLGLSATDGSAFSYGYLETFVKLVLRSGDLEQLRRHYNDLTVAREFVAAKR